MHCAPSAGLCLECAASCTAFDATDANWHIGCQLSRGRGESEHPCAVAGLRAAVQAWTLLTEAASGPWSQGVCRGRAAVGVASALGYFGAVEHGLRSETNANAAAADGSPWRKVRCMLGSGLVVAAELARAAWSDGAQGGVLCDGASANAAGVQMPPAVRMAWCAELDLRARAPLQVHCHRSIVPRRLLPTV
eukprot:COSAG01_NODE_16156_length_1265_cov_0.680103_1_plen_192_part_00